MLSTGRWRQGLDEVEGFAIRQADDSFLVASGAALISTALAADFTVVVSSADFDDLFVENGFNGLLDFELVSKAVHFENHLVILLLEQGGFFAEADVFDDLVDVFHGRKFGSLEGLGGALGEDRNGVTHKDDRVGEEQLLDVEFDRSDKLRPCDVARGEFG